MVCVSRAFFWCPGRVLLIYDQPLRTFSETIGVLAVVSFHAAAAYVLRGPLRIDLGLHRRRDVVLYVSITTAAALASTGIGVICLAGDHAIQWSEFWRSSSVWFLGDEVGLLGVAPFLLIHVFPWVRSQLSPVSALSRPQKKTRHKETPTYWIAVEVGGQISALLLSVWVVFSPQFRNFQVFFLTFIPIIWIAMRQGIQRVVSGLLALNFAIVVALHFFSTNPHLVLSCGLLMFVLSATGLFVGSAITERHRIAVVQLSERTAELLDANTQDDCRQIQSRGSQPDQERVSGQYESRDPHTHEWDCRNDRIGAGYRPQRRATRLPHHAEILRRIASGCHQ